jgi:hypothetical protein
VGRCSAFSYSASRYSYSYSKTPESIQFDYLFREAGTPGFGPFVNEIPISLFEYEYRFTEYEYEYEKNQWYELPATRIEALGACLGFDFEDRFDLDGRSGGDLGKAQSASGVETVGGFAVDFVQ